MHHASTPYDFGVGPFALKCADDPSAFQTDDRLLVKFSDAELLFTVSGNARGAVHLGSYVTPWEYIFWRLERRGSTWSLLTTDHAPIGRLARFYNCRTASD